MKKGLTILMSGSRSISGILVILLALTVNGTAYPPVRAVAGALEEDKLEQQHQHGVYRKYGRDGRKGLSI
ncbi:MAG: hypothetical protein LBK23_11010 [Oscillospiraceae bacterium]|jgi:hypothetical protein|nr:hypothetical protein [Oscillospiraceae bacterium]